jgi:nicotinamide-nucleotide amidase
VNFVSSASKGGAGAVEIVTIGDELLLGFTIDTNAAHLARTLAGLGVSVVRRATVGDDAHAIGAAVREALDRTGAVITTGGLGPTSDDRTRHAIADLFGRTLDVDEAHLEWMRQRWRTRFKTEMPEANRQQAMIPAGARKLDNHHGSAPGIWIEDDAGRWVAMLPGVPREMRGMLGDTLLPLLVDRLPSQGAIRSRTLRTTGIAESLLADRIDRVPGITDGAEIAYLPSPDGVDLRLTVRGKETKVADELLTSVASRVRSTVGKGFYGEGDTDLASVVLDLCRARTLSIAVAESCTGGLLGARLTAIPGSSDVVVGGVIAYDNKIKVGLLGVRDDDLAREGAVSEPVVCQMAAGVLARTGADLGLAITGIAGPGGGTTEKPVGTVWIAATLGGETRAHRMLLWGDRDEIRRRSAQATLELARRTLVGE